ncbi:MAG: Aryl-alcohol dehydrogenase [Pseudomonadota bacterium]|jgi:aryl-alcohol dehydrogenase
MRIQAAVSREGQDVPLIEDVDIGEPRADEIRVRIVAAGVCHTDLRAHKGLAWNTPRPIVLGHEGAGIVESVGSGVLHLKVGDRVVLSGSSCGACPSCRENLPSYCREVIPRSFGGLRRDGSSALSQAGAMIHGHFFGQSSFATHAIADARGAVRIDDDVPFDIAAPLGCGVITGAGAVLKSFDLRAGQTLAVFGAGSVGLSAVMAARLAGAKHIVAVDPVASRRVLALELGATAALDAAEPDVVAAVRGLVPDGVDYVLNTTTVPAVYEAALRVLAMRGVAAFVSAPPAPLSVPLPLLLGGGRSLRGIIGGDAAPQVVIPMLLDFWRQGRFPVDRLVAGFPFADIAAVFDAFHHGSVIKPVLKMGPP